MRSASLIGPIAALLCVCSCAPSRTTGPDSTDAGDTTSGDVDAGPGLPGSPRSVTASGGASQAVVQWQPPEDDGGSEITGYDITPMMGANALTPGHVAGDKRLIVFSNLTPGTTYRFSVAAVNAQGAGPAVTSNVVTIRAAPPLAPTQVVATPGRAQATVSWVAPPDNGGGTLTFTVTPFVGGNAGTPTDVQGTSAIIPDLVGGAQMFFTVLASNSAGPGPAASSNTIVILQVIPSAPQNVTATAGPRQATVSWTAPADDGGSALTGYTVTPMTGSTAGTPTTVSGTTTSATLTGLTPGSAYTFQVVATNVNGSGPAAQTSSITIPPGPPDAPTNLVAEPGALQATFSWSPPAFNGGASITGYTVIPYEGTNMGAPIQLSASQTAVIVTQLAADVETHFKVLAKNSYGTGPAATSTGVIVLPSTPDSPQNVTLAQVGTEIVATWTAPASDGGRPITGYSVTPRINSVAGTPQMVDASTLTFTLSNLLPGTTYVVLVAAVNSVGNSANSSSNVVTTAPDVPEAPTNVSAANGSSPHEAVVTFSAPLHNGGRSISKYTVTAFQGSTPGPQFTATTVRSVNVTGLQPAGTYTFQVYATNSIGDGPPATTSSLTLPPDVPSAPTNVTGEGGDGMATVSWTAPTYDGGAPLTGYMVIPRENGIPLSPIYFDDLLTTHTITGLVNGRTYHFDVAAGNIAGYSLFGSSGIVYCGALPGAPTDVHAIAGFESATVGWTPPASSGDRPLRQYKVKSYPDLQEITVSSNTTRTTFPNLTNGVPYTFTVTAVTLVNDGPPSEPSNEVTPSCATGIACGDRKYCNDQNACVDVPAWGSCGGQPNDTALLYSAANCGACGNSVDSYFPKGWGRCNEGVPELLSCHLAPLDENDRNPTSGLLQGWAPNNTLSACTQCNSYLGGYDAPDNGIDEDCDGVDATNDSSRGLYVDPVGGNDSNTGTALSPFKTLNGVLNQWYTDGTVPANHTEIYIAAGTLTTNLSIQTALTWADDVTGIRFIGSYVAGGSHWTRTTGSNTTKVSISGTAFDMGRATATTDWKVYFDGLEFNMGHGESVARGISYSGPTSVYLQNITSTRVSSATECETVWQDYAYTTSATTYTPSLNVFNSSFQGNCSSIRGKWGTGASLSPLRLFHVQAAGAPTEPVHANGADVLDSSIETLQGQCSSAGVWNVKASTLGTITDNLSGGSSDCSMTWYLNRATANFKAAGKLYWFDSFDSAVTWGTPPSSYYSGNSCYNIFASPFDPTRATMHGGTLTERADGVSSPCSNSSQAIPVIDNTTFSSTAMTWNLPIVTGGMTDSKALLHSVGFSSQGDILRSSVSVSGTLALKGQGAISDSTFPTATVAPIVGSSTIQVSGNHFGDTAAITGATLLESNYVGSNLTATMATGGAPVRNNLVVGTAQLSGATLIEGNTFQKTLSVDGSSSAIARNNVILGQSTSTPVVTNNFSASSVWANNTILGLTTPSTCTAFKILSTKGTAFYGNVFGCLAGSTRTGILENSSTATANGLMNNVFINDTILMKQGGTADVTFIAALNHILTVPADKLGGNLALTAITDALFTDVANSNFTLQPGSPLIDASIDTSVSGWGGVTVDRMGQPRPCGSGFDVGAYEYCE